MARKTPAELNEARRKKQREEEKRQREEEVTLARLHERLAALQAAEGRKEQLESVLKGYYAEMDKLAKKAPADQVTELALRRVNELIKQCKELLQGDPFIDSIDLFVAAGERPEHRDVLLVLRDLQQGIERWERELRDLRHRLRGPGGSLEKLLNGGY